MSSGFAPSSAAAPRFALSPLKTLARLGGRAAFFDTCPGVGRLSLAVLGVVVAPTSRRLARWLPSASSPTECCTWARSSSKSTSCLRATSRASSSAVVTLAVPMRVPFVWAPRLLVSTLLLSRSLLPATVPSASRKRTRSTRGPSRRYAPCRTSLASCTRSRVNFTPLSTAAVSTLANRTTTTFKLYPPFLQLLNYFPLVASLAPPRTPLAPRPSSALSSLTPPPWVATSSLTTAAALVSSAHIILFAPSVSTPPLARCATSSVTASGL